MRGGTEKAGGFCLLNFSPGNSTSNQRRGAVGSILLRLGDLQTAIAPGNLRACRLLPQEESQAGVIPIDFNGIRFKGCSQRSSVLR